MRAVCFKPGFKESDIFEKKIEIVLDEFGNFYLNSTGAQRPQEEMDSERIRYSFNDTPFTPSSNVQMTPHNAGNYFMSYTPQYTPNHNFK